MEQLEFRKSKFDQFVLIGPGQSLADSVMEYLQNTSSTWHAILMMVER